MPCLGLLTNNSFILKIIFLNNNNNNGYFKVPFLQRTHSPLYKNGVDIEFGKTNRLKALRMKENHA